MSTTYQRALATHMKNAEPTQRDERRGIGHATLVVAGWIAAALAAGLGAAWIVSHGLRQVLL